MQIKLLTRGGENSKFVFIEYEVQECSECSLCKSKDSDGVWLNDLAAVSYFFITPSTFGFCQGSRRKVMGFVLIVEPM